MERKQILSSDDSIEFLKNISKKFTKEVLCDILKNYSKTENVQFLGINQGTNNFKKGDSYLSSLNRFTVVGTINESSKGRRLEVPVVVKSIPTNIARKKTFRSSEFFENEISFYTKVWPRLLQFQKEKNAVIFNNIPRCLAAVCDGDNDILILQDLSIENFKTLGREFRNNLEHSLLVIRMLASFHALSFAFKDQHPDEYKNITIHLKETFFGEQYRNWYNNYLKKLLDVWVDALEKEVPGSVYEKKFKDLIANDFYGQLISLVEDKGKNAVVSQGDTWLPNFMFQYVDNKPKSAFLVDFQLSRNSSFALDLSFYIFSCVDPLIRREHWDYILTEYHKTMTSCLEKLGTNPGLTYSDIKNEFIKYGKFGLGMCLETAIFSVMPDEETADLETIEGDAAVDIANVWIVNKIPRQKDRTVLVDIIKDQVDLGFI
ncbi:uncharacterized protein LOC123292301 [Chrysoperla carnea]|uniref:uncharacterized protein LOC123292301 n=1 Tax=Chrysoperla carnea TaxID=189513 RepID=UPI001D06FCF5|nr:uncharacterized protein LOC123292301 [Chrysoperla carnea]